MKIVIYSYVVDKSKRQISKLVSEKTKNFSVWLNLELQIGPLYIVRRVPSA